jgi:hypothetical protein
MDDDIIDVNCGYCGRPLRVPIDQLRDVRIVACVACSRSRGREGATHDHQPKDSPPTVTR